MAFHHEKINPSQQDCLNKIVEILAPYKECIAVASDTRLTSTNIIGGIPDLEAGFMDENNNFFSNYKMLQLWIPQQISLYRNQKFLRVNNQPVMRPADDNAMIRTPLDWTTGKETQMLPKYFNQVFEHYVNHLKFLFGDDAEMGMKVNDLVVPVADSTDKE